MVLFLICSFNSWLLAYMQYLDLSCSYWLFADSYFNNTYSAEKISKTFLSIFGNEYFYISSVFYVNHFELQHESNYIICCAATCSLLICWNFTNFFVNLFLASMKTNTSTFIFGLELDSIEFYTVRTVFLYLLSCQFLLADIEISQNSLYKEYF